KTNPFHTGGGNETHDVIGNYEIVKKETNLSVDNATGIYNGTSTLTATLSANSTALAGKTVTFFLGEDEMGSVPTNTEGIATLNNVSISGYNADTFEDEISASFEEDDFYLGSTGEGDLTVTPLEITGNFTADNKVYDGNTDAVVLTRTLNDVV